MNSIKIEVIKGYDKDRIEELIEIQNKAFPPRMQFKDALAYYDDGFKDDSNLNIIIINHDVKIIGHLLAFPQSSVYQELQQWDTTMENLTTNMYLDIIQTLPEQRTVNGVLHLLRRLCRETEKRGYKKISMHARVSNGFSKFIQKVFPESRCLRRIQNWYDSGESFDYIETPTRMK